IPHPTVGIGGAAKVMVRPASPGTRVIAGGAVRTVLELAGVKNVLAKQLGSDNPLNNARAAVEALSSLRTFQQVAEERGVSVDRLYGRAEPVVAVEPVVAAEPVAAAVEASN
ncbi:MAG: hypothetical protein ACO3NK_01785, partial [Prochlorotrichaceae cyanobacterium]